LPAGKFQFFQLIDSAPGASLGGFVKHRSPRDQLRFLGIFATSLRGPPPHDGGKTRWQSS
jgi:hypothetical protein